jgi:hypothetical protein
MVFLANGWFQKDVIPADGDQLFISQKKEQQTMQEQFLFAD